MQKLILKELWKIQYIIIVVFGISLFVIVPNITKAQVENRLGTPNILEGKVGAASFSSIDSSEYNPAQISLIPFSHIQGSWGVMSMNYNIRYPGFESNNTQKTRFDPSLPIPKFAYKFSKQFAVGGLIIPLSVNQKINAKKIPLVILRDENKVDIIGDGYLKGFANLYAGYAINKNISIGANISYYSMTGSGRLTASDVDDPDSYLAKFDIAQTVLRIGAGIKLKILNNFYLGGATSILSTKKQENAFSTLAKFEEQNLSSSSTEGKTSSNVSEIFNPIRIGVGLKLQSKIWVFSDIEYKRISKEYKEYSLVDFKEKTKDLYDTLSIYIGGEIKLNSAQELLFGACYEPSAVGQGGQGANSKAGLGFMDLALNLGDPPDKPQLLIAAGGRLKFKPTNKKAYTVDSQLKNIKHYAFILETGIVYSHTSIGIDESGEQPGAYEVQRIKIPVKLIYNF